MYKQYFFVNHLYLFHYEHQIKYDQIPANILYNYTGLNKLISEDN